MGSLTTVEFRGDTLFTVERDDGVFIAVKPISDRLGLKWSGQHDRLRRDPLLGEGVRVIRIPSLGGAQETTCLALRCVNGWLFGIDSARVKPELRERVLAYQRECYDVLADHFLGPRGAAAPIRVPDPIADSNLRVEEHKLGLVREMRLIGGPAKAYALWRKLGLIDAGPTTLPAAIDEPAPLDPAVAVAAVRDFLHLHRDTGLADAADAGDPGTWRSRGVVGFIARAGTIHLHEAGWRQATAGLDGNAVADALRGRPFDPEHGGAAQGGDARQRQADAHLLPAPTDPRRELIVATVPPTTYDLGNGNASIAIRS